MQKELDNAGSDMRCSSEMLFESFADRLNDDVYGTYTRSLLRIMEEAKR